MEINRPKTTVKLEDTRKYSNPKFKHINIKAEYN